MTFLFSMAQVYLYLKWFQIVWSVSSKLTVSKKYNKTKLLSILLTLSLTQFMSGKREQTDSTTIDKMYTSQTLVFMWNSALRGSSISIFQDFFTSIDKMFFLEGRLCTRLSFSEVLKFSWYFLKV